MTTNLYSLPKSDNSEGDLEERSHSSDPQDWPVFSYSQGNVWNTCEFSWHLGYRLAFFKPKQTEALEIGTLVHEIVEVFYTNDCSVEAVAAWVSDAIENCKPEDLAQLTKAILVSDRYVKSQHRHYFTGYRILGTELHQYASFKTKKGRNYWLQGYIDLLVERDGQVKLIDHKTTGTGFWTEAAFRMDPQTVLYCALVREGTDFRPTTTALNQLNTYPYKNYVKVPNEKLFGYLELPRSDVEISNAVKEYSRLVETLIDRYKTPRKRLSKSCDKCQFCAVCATHQAGASIEPILNQLYVKKPKRNILVAQEEANAQELVAD